jgi:hypothetical protein
LELEVIPGKGIRAQFQFPPIGTYAFADTVHGLWNGKFLNAASIGFQPGDGENSVSPIIDDAGKPTGGVQYNEWELLEFSIVPVPANQEALRLALKAIGGEQIPPQQEGAANSTDSNIDAHTQLTSDERKAVTDALSRYFATLKEVLQ